jgi:hypothetical protein
MSDAGTKPVTFLDRWTRLSLARRIILAAAVWGLIVLIGGALALSALYRAQTLSLLSDDLDQTLVTLTRDMTREGAFLPDGRVTDDNHVFLSTDSRYQTQYSGRYWAIVAVNEDGDAVGDLRSRSLWDEPVPMSPRLAGAGAGHIRARRSVRRSGRGPAEERIVRRGQGRMQLERTARFAARAGGRCGPTGHR